MEAYLSDPGDAYDMLSERCRDMLGRGDWGTQVMLAKSMLAGFAGVDADDLEVGDVAATIDGDRGTVDAELLDREGRPLFAGGDSESGDVWVFEDGGWYADECTETDEIFSGLDGEDTESTEPQTAATRPPLASQPPTTTEPLRVPDEVQEAWGTLGLQPLTVDQYEGILSVCDNYRTDPAEQAAYWENGRVDRRALLTLFSPVCTDMAAALEPSRPVGTRQVPVPLGQTADDVGGWSVVVDSVNPDAYDVLLAENRFNDPPATGNVFVMVNVTATYDGPEASNTTGLSFSAIGPSNVVVDRAYVVAPDEYPWNAEVFQGGTISGNVTFELPAGTLDETALIVEPYFSFDDTERAFMALTDTSVQLAGADLDGYVSGLTRLVSGCTRTITFSMPGTYRVYREFGPPGDAADVCDVIEPADAAFEVTVTGPSGEQVVVTPQSHPWYETADYVGEAVGAFEVAAPGDYVVHLNSSNLNNLAAVEVG